VSEWGHSFRPSYLGIPEAVEILGRPVVAALTATATPRVRSDISSLLRLDTASAVVTGFDRPNIEWTVIHDEDRRRRLLSILKESAGSVVLYTGTRRGAEEWDAFLNSRKVGSVHYHGGLPAESRKRVQLAWMQGKARVMVATSAFGMGIDKPDVRHVIHVDLPMSLEAYYQEAGRAGRDNRPAFATLIYGSGDERLPRALIDESYPTAKQITAVYSTACSLGEVAVGSLPDDPLDLDLSEVARVSGISRSQAEKAADYIERMGAWVVVPTGDHGHLRIRTAPEQLRPLAGEDHPVAIRRVTEYLLRGRQAGAWGSWIRVHPGRLARRLQVPAERLEQALVHLDMVGHVSWRPPGSRLRLRLLEARHGQAPVRRDLIEQSRRSAVARLDDLIRYVRHRGCRRNYILTYFGQSAPVRCGSCDNCAADSWTDTASLDREMIRAVLTAVRSGRKNDEWGLDLGWTLDEIDKCVDWLVHEGYLRVVPTGEMSLELTERGETLV
jgi:ATP-dependent DNA helicase RecQ